MDNKKGSAGRSTKNAVFILWLAAGVYLGFDRWSADDDFHLFDYWTLSAVVHTAVRVVSDVRHELKGIQK